MDQKHVAGTLLLAVIALQSVVSLVWPSTPTLTGIALALNAAATVSAFLYLRRAAHAPWVVAAWCAGFFGWHVLGLGVLAGWWAQDLTAVFLIGGPSELSIAYQAVLTTMSGFAVHLMLPKRNGK